MHRTFRLLTIFILAVTLFAGCGAPDSPAPPDESVAPAAQSSVETATTEPTANPTPDDPAAYAPTPVEAQADAPVAVTVANVGYGDAILVQLGEQNFLIDTGAKKAGIQLLRALAMRGVEQLDGVFLTHTHSDHIGGMETVAQRYEIGTIYAAEITQDRKKIDKLADELGLNLERLTAGDKVQTASGAAFEVLGPIAFNADDDNDNSLVLRLKAGGLTWLFTGDMQFDEEISLMNAGIDLKTDVLKVGNHGNPDATSGAFGKAVSPKAAVISTSTVEDDDSANPRVLSALMDADIYITQDYGLGVLMTAENGVLSVTDPQPPAAPDSVSIAIDAKEQTATLTASADLDLSGWFIYSEKGNELFVFPQNTKLEAGKPLIVACRGGAGHLIWDDKKVWSDKDGEAGVLYTSGGAQAARSGA